MSGPLDSRLSTVCFDLSSVHVFQCLSANQGKTLSLGEKKIIFSRPVFKFWPHIGRRVTQLMELNGMNKKNSDLHIYYLWYFRTGGIILYHEGHTGIIASKSFHNYAFKGCISLKSLKLWLLVLTKPLF